MTIQQTLQAIRALGLRAGYRDGEFRITYKGLSKYAQELSAYYTNDAEDAVVTACQMAKEV